jgi:hypothetical protein
MTVFVSIFLLNKSTVLSVIFIETITIANYKQLTEVKMSKYRNKILELFDEGNVGKDELILNLVNWLSESDAKEFWNQLEIYDFDPEC